MTGRTTTHAGAVVEIEFYSVPENARGEAVKPNPRNVRTPEQKEKYNNYKSEKQAIRLINANFTAAGYYVTLSYDAEHLPKSYDAAEKNARLFLNRLKYKFPNTKIICFTAAGDVSGRFHHHLIIEGVPESYILKKWSGGKIVKIERLRAHNYYNGMDCGEDFTALAKYLHRQVPGRKGRKRWTETGLTQPKQEKTKSALLAYTAKKPPKAPSGYRLVEVRDCEYFASSYICFKFARIPQKKHILLSFPRCAAASLNL